MPICITVDKRGDGQLQVSICKQDADGSGHGYRIAGPKYDGSGKALLKHVINERDKSEIESYLREVNQ